MIAMALPTILLYEAAILAVDYVEKRRAASTPAPPAAEAWVHQLASLSGCSLEVSISRSACHRS